MNTAEFIIAVRRSGQLSINDQAYTDAVILDEGTQALIERFAAPVSALRQGYWLHRSVQTTAASNTNGLYRLPPRAVVQGIELLEFSVDGTNFHPLNIKTQEQSMGYQDSQQSQPASYVLEGDCVRLIPAPVSGYTIRFRWYLRPPVLIPFVDVCKVSSVSANVIVVASNPSGVNVSTSTGLDIQDADGSHEVPVVGAAITSITGAGPYTITLTDTTIDTSRVSVGDYVRAPDQAVFPMLPRELHKPLADYVAAVILTSKGDAEKASNLAAKATNGIDRVVSMASPRNKTGSFTWKRNSYLRASVGRRRR